VSARKRDSIPPDSTAAEGRRRAILSASAKIFAEKGFHAAGIADIAAVLKMGHGTFYRYFSNKLDIFNAILVEIVAEVSTVTASEDPDAATTLDEYRAQVERLGRKLFSLFVENQHLARLLLLETPGVDPENQERFRAMLRVLGASTERYLANGVNRGFLRKDLDIPIAALAINGVAMEALRWVSVAEDPAGTSERWLATYVQLVIPGLIPPETRG
jgi:AcrR family transcriptional regulator